MKKFVSIFVCMLLVLAALSGCNENNNPAETEQQDKISVVSTIFAPYDFVREIVGDKAEVTMLLPPGSESHSYEPTPQDIIKIQNCDVFVYVGGDSDDWVDGVLASMDTSKMKIVTLMDCVDVVEEEIVEGMEDDHGHGHDHEGDEHHDEDHDSHHEEDHDDVDDEVAELDEHVWTSPKNAKLIVQKISDALGEVDSANEETYKQNTQAYLSELDELDAIFEQVVDSTAHKTIIFGDRFPFRYLADAYGLKYFAAFPGCSTETEASAATVAFLIDKVRDEKIPVIFHVELSNQKMANTISEATGAKVLLLHACHNITKAEFENGVSYLDLMHQNAENMKEALK